jgi:hypothetical protein
VRLLINLAALKSFNQKVIQMKILTALLAVGLVACLKPEPPKAEVIDLQTGEPYMHSNQEPGCNMDTVLNTVTEQCCPKACTPKGYDHEIHTHCAAVIIVEAKCTMYDLRMTTGHSECSCGEAVVNTCIPDETP